MATGLAILELLFKNSCFGTHPDPIQTRTHHPLPHQNSNSHPLGRNERGSRGIPYKTKEEDNERGSKGKWCAVRGREVLGLGGKEMLELGKEYYFIKGIMIISSERGMCRIQTRRCRIQVSSTHLPSPISAHIPSQVQSTGVGVHVHVRMYVTLIHILTYMWLHTI